HSDSSSVSTLAFASTPYTLHTSDGRSGKARARWTVEVVPDRHRITRRVYLNNRPWREPQQKWDAEGVIGPAWPGRWHDSDASSLTPLIGLQDYWSTAGNRLRDSAKWMAAAIGAALATVTGTSPLAVMREHRPPAIAIGLGSAGLLFL